MTLRGWSRLTLTLLVVFAAGAATAQSGTPAPQASVQTPEQRESQKWADIQRDTEKLAQLTKELQVEVDKTDKGQLSVKVLRKAEEIEKLSKSIRDRMKQS